MRNLTEKQQHVLHFIRIYSDDHSYPPSVRDIADYFSISVRAIQDHLAALRKKGYISTADKKSRSLEILNDETLEKKPKLIRVPIMGTVAAGIPFLSEENFEGAVFLPEGMIKSQNNYFALNVRGESMINAGILDGDIAIIKCTEQCQNGDIVVAVLNEAITLKRFFKESARIKLQAENPAFLPIYCQDVRIAGTLATLIRNY